MTSRDQTPGQARRALASHAARILAEHGVFETMGEGRIQRVESATAREALGRATAGLIRSGTGFWVTELSAAEARFPSLLAAPRPPDVRAYLGVTLDRDTRVAFATTWLAPHDDAGAEAPRGDRIAAAGEVLAPLMAHVRAGELLGAEASDRGVST